MTTDPLSPGVSASSASTVALPRGNWWKWGILYLVLGVYWLATAALATSAGSYRTFQLIAGVLFTGLGVAWTFTNYRFEDGALDTYLGPMRIRHQPIRPAAVWTADGWPRRPVAISADASAVIPRPPFLVSDWRRRIAADGHVGVSSPWPIPAQEWATVLGVPLRDYGHTA